MHAGSGDANYGVIDKLVQRDITNRYPCVHASSLKGALRQHAEEKWGSKDDPRVLEVFGTDANESKDTKSGSYRFLGAELLALPIRCNYRQFALSFCKRLTQLTNEKAKTLVSKEIFKTVTSSNKLFADILPATTYEVFAEDVKLEAIAHINPLACNATGLNGFSSQYACLEDIDFALAAENLPVIARNYLVDSNSKNLWYEELVPHQTLFITYMASTKPNSDFEKLMLDGVIQVGGNATVGYGLCKFYPVTF
jgi:CRISPR-associated protein Cmr4